MERGVRRGGGVPERLPAAPVRPPPGPAGSVRRSPEPSGPVSSPLCGADLAHLQRFAGNRQVARLLRPPTGRPAVQRWDGPEHVELGNTSRGPQPGRILLDAHSADLPQHNRPVTEWPPQWQELYRKGNKEQKQMLQDGLSYGEVVALSGDLYKGFDALNRAPLKEIYDLIPLVRTFASTEALETASGGRYLTLAAENESHFTNTRPGHANIDVWWRNHAAAIRAARAGQANRAWGMNAGADHFLTDAFSGGHIRVPRSALHAEGKFGDVKSKIAHDLDNENGVEVTNPRGDRPWIAYGDDMLVDPRNSRNKQLAEEAVALSKQDIADALAQGMAYPQPTADTVFAAQRLVPHPTDPTRNRWSGTDKATEVAGLAKNELPGQVSSVWQEDNRVREWINRQDLPAIGRQPVEDRVRMINVLLGGPTMDDDENAILRVLRASVLTGSHVPVIDAIGAHRLADDIDGAEYDQLRQLLRAGYYAHTTAATALHLIVTCIDGPTHEWEESMIVDLLELQPDPRALVIGVGQKYGGTQTGPDRDFRNGIHELDDQLDGADNTKLHRLFPGPF